MPHKENCTDKSELGIDDKGRDFCMNCGEIIECNEDQFIIQEVFLKGKPMVVKKLDKKLLKRDLEKLLAFYYRHASLDKIEASRIFPHLFVYIDILNHDLKVKK